MLHIMAQDHPAHPMLDHTNNVPLRGDWTIEQDDALRRAVNVHGGKNWKRIAADIPGEKTHVQCLQRWNKVIKPGLVKGPWKQQEDDMLRASLDDISKNNWVAVSEKVPGRTPKQCRERWLLCLDPRIKKDKWTQEEDAVLLRLHEEHGNAWAFLSRHLNGRTENAIKSRMKSLQKKVRRNSTSTAPWEGEEDVASANKRQQPSAPPVQQQQQFIMPTSSMFSPQTTPQQQPARLFAPAFATNGNAQPGFAYPFTQQQLAAAAASAAPTGNNGQVPFQQPPQMAAWLQRIQPQQQQQQQHGFDASASNSNNQWMDNSSYTLNFPPVTGSGNLSSAAANALLWEEEEDQTLQSSVFSPKFMHQNAIKQFASNAPQQQQQQQQQQDANIASAAAQEFASSFPTSNNSGSAGGNLMNVEDFANLF